MTRQCVQKMFFTGGRRAFPANQAQTTQTLFVARRNRHKGHIRDVTIFHGGHFAILVTGCDNMTVDNVTMDTDRDGIGDGEDPMPTIAAVDTPSNPDQPPAGGLLALLQEYLRNNPDGDSAR